MEQTAMGLPKQLVPARQRQGWLGQQKLQVCKPLLLWPERCDQSHRDTRRLLDAGDHPPDQRKGRERVQVQVVPRMAKRILEDGLGIRDKRAIQGQLRVKARRKQVDRRVAPNAKKRSRHLRVERPLCPYNLPATAENICQDVVLAW